MNLLQDIENALIEAQKNAWGSALPCKPYPILDAELGDFASDLCIRLAGERKQTIQTCVAKVTAGLSTIKDVTVSEMRGFINFRLPTEASWKVEMAPKRELVILVAPLWRELGEAAAVRFLSFVFARARAAARLGWNGRIVSGSKPESIVVWSGSGDAEWFEHGRKLFDVVLADKRPNVAELLKFCSEYSAAEVWSPAVFFPDSAISGTERELARNGSILKLIHRTMLFGFECEESARLVKSLGQEEFFNFIAALTVPDQGCSINPSLYKYITIDSPRAFALSLRQRLTSVIGGAQSSESDLCLSVQDNEQRIARLIKAFAAWQQYAGVSGEIVQYGAYRRELLATLNRYLNDPRMRSALADGKGAQTAQSILAAARGLLSAI